MDISKFQGKVEITRSSDNSAYLDLPEIIIGNITENLIIKVVYHIVNNIIAGEISGLTNYEFEEKYITSNESSKMKDIKNDEKTK